MADSDLIKLYSGRILALAAGIPHIGRLDAPDATAKKRSPQCGSTVTVDITVEDGRITDFAQDVKACALGQASAALFGAQAIGLDLSTVSRLRDDVRAMLSDGAAPPAVPFDGYEVLRPAAEFRNRHSSILLALDATVDALEQSCNRACA